MPRRWTIFAWDEIENIFASFVERHSNFFFSSRSGSFWGFGRTFMTRSRLNKSFSLATWQMDRRESLIDGSFPKLSATKPLVFGFIAVCRVNHSQNKDQQPFVEANLSRGSREHFGVNRLRLDSAPTNVYFEIKGFQEIKWKHNPRNIILDADSPIQRK